MAVPAQGQIEEPQQGRYFEVPAMNVQHFVGRRQLLEKINTLFEDDEKLEEKTRVVVLRGMGGQ